MNDCYKGGYCVCSYVWGEEVVLLHPSFQNMSLDNIYSIPTHSLIFYKSISL